MHNNEMPAAVLLLSLAGFAIPVAAQDSSEIQEDTPKTVALEAVVVTAERREEELFNVPGSVIAVEKETLKLRAYGDTEELIRSVPNAHFTETRAGVGESNFSIRGVGTTTINVDQTIGFYVDDIPFASVTEFGHAFHDVWQVEVLRGPQGTLYGRNALGGVVHIKTADPESEWGVDVSASMASENKKRMAAIINAPLQSDRLLARLSLVHEQRDPDLKNQATDAADVGDTKVDAGRLKLLYLPSDSLSLMLTADKTTSERNSATGLYDTVFDDGVHSLRPAALEQDNDGLSLTVEVDMGGFSLTSLTSVRRQDHGSSGARPEAQNFSPLVPETVVFDNDFAADLDQTTLTQEVRLASIGDSPLTWIAGLFYQHNEADRTGEIVNVTSSVFERSFATVEDSSMALFGDLTYGISDTWALTGGVRVSRDEKQLAYHHDGSFAPLFGVNFAPNLQFVRDESFTDVSPRLVLEYKPHNNILWYAKVARGYKSGGFNTEFLADNGDPYDKETLLNYEGGIKSRHLDGRLELEASVFRMDWSDQQVLVFTQAGSQITNAKESRSTGTEFQVRFRPSRQLLLTAALGYVDATFEETPVELPVEGFQQPNAPKKSASLSGRYDFSLTNAGNAYVSADLSYQSEFYWDVNNTLEEPAHQFVNLYTGFETKQFDIGLYVKNATDEEYRTSAMPASPGFFESQGLPGQGREFGLTLHAIF